MKTSLIFFAFVYASLAFGEIKPFLCFSDAISGPATGNSDTSLQGQVANKDGAIITIWGKHLGAEQGNSKILIDGKEARVYQWANATSPADLYTHLQMQMISFQIPSSANIGLTDIYVVVNNQKSNKLPFAIREGNIYFISKLGNDETGNGSWQAPWATLDNSNYTGALEKIKAGDFIYVLDGVNHVDIVGDRGCIDLGPPGTETHPKSIIAYPYANATIGTEDADKSYVLWVSGIGLTSNFTISKFNLIADNEAASMHHGFRVVGNKITAPKGDGPTGAVAGLGNNLYLLGNEITNVGFKGTSKLYHPIYIQSYESCNGPRLPLESNREIAWNDLHDNLSFDGINIYRECGSSAYMTNHRVHDNFILNQTGCGIRCGDYVVGENWIYNNIIAHAGLGPDPITEQAMHVPVMIHAGWNDTTTLIHFYNNIIYGGGFKDGAAWSSSMVAFAYNHPFDLDFRDNIIVSTIDGISYMNPAFNPPMSGVENNLWYGSGEPPAWDEKAYSFQPVFEDVSQFDFHSLSYNTIDLAIGDGQIFPTPSYDFDGVARPQGTKADLGCFEKIVEITNVKENTNVDIKIWPNPSNDLVTIDFGSEIFIGEKLKIINILNEVVFDQKIISKNITLPTNVLRNGMYILKVKNINEPFIVCHN